MMRYFAIVPLIGFVFLVTIFATSLIGGKNPTEVTSALIGKPVPAFELPGLSSKDFGGEPVLLNVFASWCVSCVAEQDVLMHMRDDDKVKIYGLNYKDTPEKMKAWLAKNGNPFDRIGEDATGRVAVDFGVYGVPETFVIDAKGIVRYKHVGPVDEKGARMLLDKLKEVAE